MDTILGHSVLVFIIVLISGLIVNLLKRHFIIQLAGISFLLFFYLVKAFSIVQNVNDIVINELYLVSFPVIAGITACLVSMVLGFWLFPSVRRKFKD